MSYEDKRISQGYSGEQSINRTKTIYFGKVVSILDNHNIKVRIKGLDTKITNELLPICYSLLPMHIHMLPKVGEVVRIILSDTSFPFDERLWVGPVITNYEYLGGQMFNYGDVVTIDQKSFSELEAPVDRANFEQSSGVFPAKGGNSDEQKLLGRGNTEITIGKRKVEIKAGKHELGNINARNSKNPALVQTRISEDGNKTTSLIIADSILLLSHKGTPLMSAIRKEEITDIDLINLTDEAHPIPFGDVLLTFCNLVRDAMIEHAHPESGMSAITGNALNKLINFDLEALLSKSIKIN